MKEGWWLSIGLTVRGKVKLAEKQLAIEAARDRATTEDAKAKVV